MMAGTPVARIIDREVISATDAARRILDAAQAQAQQIIASAQEAHDRAVREGLDEGRRQGISEWLEENNRLRESLRQIIENAKPQIVRIALRVAEKILRQKLDATPDAIAPMVEEALRSLRAQTRVILRVHPDDRAALDARRGRWVERNPSIGNIDILADETLQRGGCRIETEFGMVDATIETQLRVIERHLLGGGLEQ